MDGDNHQRKQHDPSSYPSVSGLPRHVVQQQQPASLSTERFRRPSLQSAQEGDISISAHGRNTRLPEYGGYGYTAQQAYGESSVPGPSLQGAGLQYQTGFPSGSLRPDASQRRLQQQSPDYPHQRQTQQFSSYGTDLVYNIDQQGQAQASYEIPVPTPYQARQSAALGALSTPFGVPQYFTPTEHAGPGDTGVVSQYLTPQAQPATYHQQNPLGRSSAAQSYPTAMADYNPVGTNEGVEQQETAPASVNLDDEYSQYQQALRAAFDYTRAGRLADASRSLLEISEWLIGNSRDLGLLRDEPELHAEKLQLWNNFNLCWLAVCQKQKDLTQVILETGQSQPNTTILTVDMMEKMGQDLVRLCDKMEPHGLVDYQMGIWEEEILSALNQCLDLVEARHQNIMTRS